MEIFASILAIVICFTSLVAFVRSIYLGVIYNKLKEQINHKCDELDCNHNDIKQLLVDIDPDSIRNCQKAIVNEMILRINNEVDKKIASINTDCRCPKCNGITKPGSKICSSCGEPFFKDKNKIIHGRVLSCSSGPSTEFYFNIKWECLECEAQADEEWDDDELGEDKFIFPLKCDNCEEYCGEILIDPSADPVKISKVCSKGELQLSS